MSVVAQHIPNDLILYISDYDYLSPIYFTNKLYYKKGSEIRNKAVIKGFEFDLGYHLEDLKIDYNLSFVQGDNLTLDLPLSFIIISVSLKSG